jgi:hypothetical protein
MRKCGPFHQGCVHVREFGDDFADRLREAGFEATTVEARREARKKSPDHALSNCGKTVTGWFVAGSSHM